MPLTNDERQFLAAYIYEESTEPFKGPATDDLHAHDIFCTDILGLLGAYSAENPADQENFGGKRNPSPPPCPWADKAEALRRNHEIEMELATSARP